MKLSVCSCVSAAIVVALAGSTASAVVTMQTRFLVQQTTGSGATYTVTNANTTTFLPGSRVRLTVQFRLLNTQPTVVSMRNIAAIAFGIEGSGEAGGNTQRSQLFGRSGAPSIQDKGEAYGELDGFDYPGVGAETAAAKYRSGLHRTWRDGLSDTDGAGPLTNDQNLANGSYVGDDVNIVIAYALSVAFLPEPTSYAETPWQGLYSFEYQHSGSLGSKAFTFAPLTATIYPNGRFLYYEVDNTSVLRSESFQNGSVTLNFAIPAPGAASLLALGGVLALRRGTRSRG